MLFEVVNVDFSASGTRFLLYPQAPVLRGFQQPEAVYVSIPPRQIERGPGDERMYVAHADDKPSPYEYPYLPPYKGPTLAPAEPGPRSRHALRRTVDRDVGSVW